MPVSAFPVPKDATPGISFRDYAAIQFLSAMISAGVSREVNKDKDALQAYEYADAFLIARTKKPER